MSKSTEKKFEANLVCRWRYSAMRSRPFNSISVASRMCATCSNPRRRSANQLYLCKMHIAPSTAELVAYFRVFVFYFSIRNPKWKFDPETMAACYSRALYEGCQVQPNDVGHRSNKQQIAITKASGMEGGICPLSFSGCFVFFFFFRLFTLSTALLALLQTRHFRQNRNGLLTMAINILYYLGWALNMCKHKTICTSNECVSLTWIVIFQISR